MRLNQTTQADYLKRLATVTADAKPGWGRLTPAGMLAHLRAAIEISLGEIPARDESNLLGRTLGKFLVFHVLPWPKGKIKAPAVFLPDPTEFSAEHTRLLAAIGRFVAAAQQTPARVTIHNAFGPLTLNYWEKVHGKHVDYHLRQFNA